MSAPEDLRQNFLRMEKHGSVPKHFTLEQKVSLLRVEQQRNASAELLRERKMAEGRTGESDFDREVR